MVENASQFLSTYSLKVFTNDAYQIKKITEQLIYEPLLNITVNNNFTQNTITFTNYEDVETAYLNTILLSGSILTSGESETSGQAFVYDDIAFIRFGTGSHTVLSGVSDVQTYSHQLISGQFQEITDVDYSDDVILRKTITDFTYDNKFSEIALWNVNSGCILYSTFPMIEYPEEKIYSNIKFQFKFE